MNLGRVKSFLIVLFLGINIYLAFSMYFSTRFFVDKETIASTREILSGYGISVKEEIIPRYTVNLRNIDTRNIVYTELFKKTSADECLVDKNGFRIVCQADGISKKSDRAVIREVSSLLRDKGFDTRYMKFQKGKNKWHITCSIKDFEIFDSGMDFEIKDNEIIISGTWFEPGSSDIRSHSRERDTMYASGILMEMSQNERILRQAPFEITDIRLGYLAGMPYGNGSHVTATALPYYRIRDSKGNTYYYDALSGAELKSVN